MTTAAAEDRVNLVPLIDCMFFLILFFLLAMRFAPDELAIASLLPTSGGGGMPTTTTSPTRTVAVTVLPAGLPRGLQPSGYQSLVAAQRRDGSFARRLALRVGGSEPIEIDGAALARGASDAAGAGELARAHAYLARELAARDTAGAARADQPAIVIGACSQLPWSGALIALDGVRAYERDRDRDHSPAADAATVASGRAISFMAPPTRAADGGALGDELFQLANLR